MKYSGPAITQVKTAISFGSECSNHSGVANNYFSFAFTFSITYSSSKCYLPARTISSFRGPVRFWTSRRAYPSISFLVRPDIGIEAKLHLSRSSDSKAESIYLPILVVCLQEDWNALLPLVFQNCDWRQLNIDHRSAEVRSRV